MTVVAYLTSHEQRLTMNEMLGCDDVDESIQ
jgi:hypothetical protein